MSTDQFPKWDYKEYPKTLPVDDLWGQVRRTIHGKPVAEDQIQMMVDAMIAGLNLQQGEVLLDLGCGNAALTARLFPYCDKCVGVDFSEYLIGVANARFADLRHKFVYQNAFDYVEQEQEPLQFDKVLCFAMVSYLTDSDAYQLFLALNQRFERVSSVFIGNVPDPDCAKMFYENRDIPNDELTNPESQIGVWRSRAQMHELGETTGWRTNFQDMPKSYYQANYRYNAIFTRGD